MGVKIYVPAGEAWTFYQRNRDRLKDEMVMVAENTETGYAVYLTEDREIPNFCVCRGEGEPEYEEGVVSQTDCEDTAERFYAKYLFPIEIDSDKGFPEPALEPDNEDDAVQHMRDRAYEREDELSLALCDFLAVALDFEDDPPELYNRYGDDFVNETLDHIQGYLSDKWGVEIFRPAFYE